MQHLLQMSESERRSFLEMVGADVEEWLWRTKPTDFDKSRGRNAP